jgi:deoxyribonuclease-4
MLSLWGVLQLGLLGAHVSVKDGVDLSPERARILGCDSMQIFTRNQMQWKARVIGEDETKRFKQNVKKHSIQKVMAHDSYLINLSAIDKKILEMSKEAFIDEMGRARMLDIDFLVFHPGSHLGSGETKGMKKVSENVRSAILKIGKGKPRVLFETTAGQGSNLGYSFDQMSTMLGEVGMDDQTGVCFDTCHSYAAGYDIATEDGYEKTFQQFDEEIGLDRLFAFHLNDSKGAQGSRLDRHDNIGKGRLGKAAFARLVNDGRFVRHPMVLETPGGDEGYIKDLKALRSLIKTGRG